MTAHAAAATAMAAAAARVGLRAERHQGRRRRAERLRRDAGADDHVRQQGQRERAVRLEEDVIGPVRGAAVARRHGERERERAPGRHREPRPGSTEQARDGGAGEGGDQDVPPGVRARGVEAATARVAPALRAVGGSKRSSTISTSASMAA